MPAAAPTRGSPGRHQLHAAHRAGAVDIGDQPHRADSPTPKGHSPTRRSPARSAQLTRCRSATPGHGRPRCASQVNVLARRSHAPDDRFGLGAAGQGGHQALGQAGTVRLHQVGGISTHFGNEAPGPRPPPEPRRPWPPGRAARSPHRSTGRRPRRPGHQAPDRRVVAPDRGGPPGQWTEQPVPALVVRAHQDEHGVGTGRRGPAARRRPARPGSSVVCTHRHGGRRATGSRGRRGRPRSGARPRRTARSPRCGWPPERPRRVARPPRRPRIATGTRPPRPAAPRTPRRTASGPRRGTGGTPRRAR